MATTLWREGITIAFGCQFKLSFKDSHIPKIIAGFAVLLSHFFWDFFQKVLVAFGEYASTLLKVKPINCNYGIFIYERNRNN